MKKINILFTITFLFILVSSCKIGENKATETKETLEDSTMIKEVTEENQTFEQYGMLVASKKVDCEGVGMQKCMLVKERGSQVWEYFYEEIEGFSYEEGFEYLLEVRRLTRENVPADASMYRYVMVNEISKTKKDSDIKSESGKTTFDGVWKLKKLNGKDVSKFKATATFKEMNMSLYSGCNNAFGFAFITDNEKMLGINGDKIGSTKMACADDSIEEDYFKTILKTGSFKATENELSLFVSGKLLMVFER